jgi:hypothetical protein
MTYATVQLAYGKGKVETVEINSLVGLSSIEVLAKNKAKEAGVGAVGVLVTLKNKALQGLIAVYEAQAVTSSSPMVRTFSIATMDMLKSLHDDSFIVHA